MMKFIVMAGALAIGSGAAFAAPTNDQRSVGTTARSTVYCFDAERAGTRILERICQTEKDWNAEGIEIPRKFPVRRK